MKKINKNQVKENRKKRKINKVNLWAIIVSALACFALLCLAIGLGFTVYLLKDKPELDISDFINSESSIIYDENGETIAELGTTIRENVSYEDLPNSLIDAFVAVEDSRYFEHNGFDVPRFTKAIFANLKTMSFSQGGSTFTMQLVKNTYFSNDATGQQASRSGLDGVKRKLQEIFLSMELENSPQANKQTIFELYLNKLNYGGNRNIRGIQKAAEYYFGKDVTDLNLAESAMLAGVVNAPNAYNPFYNLEAATYRRNEVLYLMNYHGYITDEEYQMAKAIKVEDLLVDIDSISSSNGVAIPYQSYIDQVISEVYDLTGKDPYTTSMQIYTYMNKDIQTLMDSIQNGNQENIVFPDDEFELASICINNQTGAIVGILGGRNYAGGGSLLLNHATQQYKQPGSAIKPILDYVLAFENLGWATSHVLVDKPIVYPGTSVIISNSNGKYAGQVTLADALGNSLNTPAIQTLQKVLEAKDTDYVVNYLNSMGIEIDKADFDVQNAIGGNKITVSCLQLAAAQGALINGGQYTKPHTVSRIEFMNTQSPITPVYTSTQTVSAEASFMMATLLESNVSGDYANLMQILKDSYPVYAKTGTTDWGNSGTIYGIPNGAIKDAWMVASTTNYSVATWIGYEKGQVDKQSYITLNSYLNNIQGKTTNAIIDASVASYGKPDVLEKPDGVVKIRHILATEPYASPIDGMDEKYIVEGYIKKEYASLINPETVNVESMTSNPEVSYDIDEEKITIKWPTYPNSEDLTIVPEEMDISLKRQDGTILLEATGTRLFDYSWVYGPIRYKAEIKINGIYYTTVTSEKEENSFDIDVQPGDEITVSAYYAYENQNISSAQKTVSIKINDEEKNYIFPSTNDPYEIKEYIEKNHGTANVVIKTPTIENVEGTIILKDDKNNKQYTLGSSYSIKPSEFTKLTFTITYYKAQENKLGLTKSTVDESNNIIITANNANGTIKWTVTMNNKNYDYTVINETSISINLNNVNKEISILATDSSSQASITISN